MSNRNKWNKQHQKLDTSFLKKDVQEKNATEIKQLNLNQLLTDDLNEEEVNLQQFKKSIYDDSLSDNEVLFSFEDDLEIIEDDELIESFVEENKNFKDDSKNLNFSKTVNPLDLRREKNDKSIYNDIRELEILYEEFKNHKK